VKRAIAGLAFVAAASATAQKPEARTAGVVRDSVGRPISDAHVTTATAGTLTDSVGRFSIRLDKADSTTITVRRIGYESVSFTIATDSMSRNDLAIELSALPRVLPGIAVTKDRAHVPTIDAFEERRRTRAGLGFFLSRAELAPRDAEPLTSILRSARGVAIVRGPAGRNVLRFARWSAKKSCKPEVFLDGVQVKEFEIDDVVTRDVEAIELYASASSAPFEFPTREFSCGIVGIWTRRPLLRTP
jgi:carboxypeptidase family protein